MVIQKTSFLDLLNAQVQYRIPIYQRQYSWEHRDCKTLLDDIIDIAQDDKRNQHFIGSIIYKAAGSATVNGAVNINFVIDGQQRLTTLALILLALGHHSRDFMPAEEYKNSDLSTTSLKEDYLVNNSRFETTEIYYRLKLVGDDDISFRSLINDKPCPTDIEYSRIYDNYNYILSLLKNRHEVAPNEILAGIKRLVIANISLEPNDNAQLMFETVNSTGRPLHEVDKVRNYILMNAGEELQKELYETHWHPMEQRLGITTDGGAQLNDFFFQYACIVTEDKTPQKYYEVFKDHYLGIDPNGIRNLVEEMDAFSVFYKRWIDCDQHQSGINLLLYYLKSTNNNKCLPVVLKLLHNNSRKIISDDDLINVLKLLESYILRREMCGIPSNAIGEAFIKMLRCSDSLDRFKLCIVSDLTDRQRMPDDNEMRQVIKQINFYDLTHCRTILDRMERHLNPEYVCGSSSITIEHIMPQTIESSESLYARSDYSLEEKQKRDWATDLGENWEEIYKKYCNTIGNLTLTGYNSTLSNYRFLVKRDIKEKDENGLIFGYSASCIKLSQSLRALNQWGEYEILARADEMLKIIISIWPYPFIQLSINDNADLNNMPSDSSTISDKDIISNCVSRIESKHGVLLERIDSSTYKTVDRSRAYLFYISKSYPQGKRNKYWFAYRNKALKKAVDCKEVFMVYAFRNTDETIVLPVEYINRVIESCNVSVNEDGSVAHWHFVFFRDSIGHMTQLLSHPKPHEVSIDEYKV